MKKACYTFLLLLILPTYIFAQGKNKTIIRRKAAAGFLPGSLVADFGFSFLTDKPDEMDLGFWGSKIFNTYYFYNIHLGQSNFTVRPGIGLGLESYKFKNDFTLTRANDTRKPMFEPASKVFPQSKEIKKSKLYTNYVDFPLEVRFNSKRKNRKKGFFVALGGKIGVLFNSHTKVIYREDSQRKKTKVKEKFGLNPIRYGVYGKIGVGRLGLFYSHTLSTLFEKDKGPDKTTDTRPYSIGLSFAIF